MEVCKLYSINPVESVIQVRDRKPQPQVWEKPKMREDVTVTIVSPERLLDILV
jgi:hypothetical protein